MASKAPKYEAGALATPDGVALPFMIIGNGPIPLVVLRGINDARRQLARDYRRRLKKYRMLILSRRQPIPPDFKIEMHADDAIWAIEQLHWEPSFFECSFAGGPVGQWIAVKRPDLVKGLVLSSSLHRTDDYTRQVLKNWIDLCERRKWSRLNWDLYKHTYRPRKVRIYRLIRPLARFIIKSPKYPERPGRILSELLELDQSSLLPKIACRTLVIGGADDRVVKAEVQQEMASLIPNSCVKLYAGYGQGNELENPAYQLEFDHFVQESEGKP
jgi:pimeloyl-ACP methyl ester carboxylesterase